MKIRYVCVDCGSDNVTMDGVCTWDKDKQDWVLASMYDDAGHCNDCGEERDFFEDIIE